MDELKRCPFCGKSVKSSIFKGYSEPLVECSNPKCPLHHSLFLLSKWQNRPIEDSLQDIVAGLKAQLVDELTNQRDRLVAWEKSVQDMNDSKDALLTEHQRIQDLATRVQKIYEEKNGELDTLRKANQWIFVEEKFPDLNEVGWSNDVQLAYKVEGATYHGSQIVSRYFRNYKTGEMDWQYCISSTLREYGYEAVAWKPLGPGPDTEYDPGEIDYDDGEQEQRGIR